MVQKHLVAAIVVSCILGCGSRTALNVPSDADPESSRPSSSCFRKLAAGSMHACVNLYDNSLYCWGNNASGQLALSLVSANVDVPKEVSSLDHEVIDLALGDQHSCALDGARTAFCFGNNYWGQLGNGKGSAYYEQPHTGPQQVEGLSNVRKLVAGGTHSCAVVDEGRLYCWGNGLWGQLGIGEAALEASQGMSTPQFVQALGASVVDVTAGDRHTCASTTDGELWCWGGLVSGTTGPIHGDPIPTRVSGIPQMATLSAGEYFTCALREDGSVWCWGSNDFGQLGDNQTDNEAPRQVQGLGRATQIASGTNHACALLSDQSVRCWGGNYKGQLGIGIKSSSPEAPSPTLPLDGPVVQIAVGGEFGCALTSIGSLWCWGDHSFGQLGTKALASGGYGPPSPVPVRVQVTCP